MISYLSVCRSICLSVCLSFCLPIYICPDSLVRAILEQWQYQHTLWIHWQSTLTCFASHKPTCPDFDDFMSWSRLAVPIYWYDNQVSAFCLLNCQWHACINSFCCISHIMSSLKLVYFFFVGIWDEIGAKCLHDISDVQYRY